MKTLILTGGSRGIGAATARTAAQRGYAVCIVYLRDREAAGAVVEAIRSAGGTAIRVEADVSRESDVIGVFEKVDGEFGRLTAFSIPHWRFLETFDEHFGHPAQLRSASGAPLHGRWRIYGIGLSDDVLRKVYYANALRYLPAVRESFEKQLAAQR